MNLKQIEKIMQLMQQYDMHKITVSEADSSISLARNCAGELPRAAHAVSPASVEAPRCAPPGEPGASLGEQRAESVASASAEARSRDLKEIKSPFVGTFYLAASPGADPFVYIGKKVKKGDVLCIIEAMKLMNEIEAERDATIVEILVGNEEPVEYDQGLFLFE